MSKEAMKQALEALINHHGNYVLSKKESEQPEAAIKALEKALAKQEHCEPVAFKPPAKWRDDEIANGCRGIRWVAADGVYGRPTQEDVEQYLGYTTPQQAKQEQGEPVAWESVLGAVARGWCYEENANKTMDSELAVAIAKEVHALYTTTTQAADG